MRKANGVSGFSEFSPSWTLSDCLVTRDLLSQIERQLELLEADLLGVAPHVERQYEIAVRDEVGVETFYAASHIPLSGFPETTESVRILFEANATKGKNAQSSENSLKVNVFFRNSSHGNGISIRLRGPLARERAVGFCERIDQLIEPYELKTWLFRRRDWVLGICGIIAFFAGLVTVFNAYDQMTALKPNLTATRFWCTTVVAASCGAYLAIVEIFHPRCAFETSRWGERQRWKIWAMEAFATLVIFEGLLAGLWSKVSSAFGWHTS